MQREFNNSPMFCRARLSVFRDLIDTTDKDSTELSIYRNGVVRDKEHEKKLVEDKIKNENFPDTPLSFFELCRFNTWFNIYPEKVCGEEIITSSREFPISIKGNRKTIDTAFQKEFGNNTIQLDADNSTNESLELEALALELELQILNL